MGMGKKGGKKEKYVDEESGDDEGGSKHMGKSNKKLMDCLTLIYSGGRTSK